LPSPRLNSLSAHEDELWAAGRRTKCECRRRVSQTTVAASSWGFSEHGTRRGEVAATGHAKEAVRELYAHAEEQTASEWIDHLIQDMADGTWPSRCGRSGAR
jgi:hypothetical protein